MYKLDASYFGSPLEALKKALGESKKNDLILVCGSFFILEKIMSDFLPNY